MDLRPFDPYVPCPACGAERPQLRYCVGLCAVIDLGGVIEQAPGRGDPHLHWICGRCSYEALMACAPPRTDIDC
jgi:hypothetical protein